MLTHAFGQPGGSFLVNLLNRAKDAVSRWWEIGRLDPQEIDVAARDLNISSVELVALMRTPSDALDPLSKRLEFDGFTSESLARSHPHELRDLCRVCSQCLSKTRCARDIRHKRMATPSKYCPNELTLRLLVREAYRDRSARVLNFPENVA
jgi:hypothetical protein